ncbi:MAG: asparagine synthase (glutamine-hydrolyzing) [Candidatus Micrarchaeota archaeon]|nr:asparagine synthase (glutamine-hydrolyzing) [Candidatus Micrarchaeota archaeon]
MCGISAAYGKHLKNKEQFIRDSLALVKHRGYSLNEIKVLENCVFGCNRLQIVDRQNGIQPQTNEDGTVSVVFNGEIFNYNALQSTLSSKGHFFKTNSDTEVLVHLWEDYKEKMVEKLDSEMFAFFIYDEKNDVFFAARDPYGVKPLYYAIDVLGNYYFSSEIKQLVPIKEISEVKFFPPGNYMLSGKLVPYHAFPRQSKNVPSDEEAILTVRKLFDEAVKKRVETDLPIGVFFSGGIDSSSVLATAIKYNKKITAFTVGTPNSPDVVVAKRYCLENNIPLKVFTPPSEEKLSELIPEMVYATESFEPNMLKSGIIAFYLAKLAKDNGFKVILCGEGADEIFAGYPEFGNCKTDSEVDQNIFNFVTSLPRTQFQRVDRTSMLSTLEVRIPFFDTAFADYCIALPGKFKLRNIGGKLVKKWVLREAMKDRLPDYIVNREKVVFCEGAGYAGNQAVGGLFYDIIMNAINDAEFKKLKNDYPDWPIADKEVAYYFKYYARYLFTKAKFNQQRPTVNTISSVKA